MVGVAVIPKWVYIMTTVVAKRVRFWPASLKDSVRKLDTDVAEHIAQALHDAKLGLKSAATKPFGEDRRLAKVMKIVKDAKDGNTYRGVYTIEFPEAVWVLDVFAKKSTQGIATPKADIERIVGRLKDLREYRDTPKGKVEVNELLIEYGQKIEAAKRDKEKSYGQPTRKPKGT
jgi:phage-related protein